MTSRKGSALLVVLGMLSFMLFSGLAFSVYMRYSRLSTSFLRRTSVTRQLAKAALAEAIHDIDSAIGNDPYPGVGSRSSVQNTWNNRIFIGKSGTYDTVDNNAVSVMPLEGLAYVPPNLINEVRYFSRCTPTAKWKSFWFDSGRYAYVAVDVSDYFDVNRMIANLPRASSANRRLGFAHLFEEISEGSGDHTGPGMPEKWDDFLESSANIRTVDDYGNITFSSSDSPFISMADFNCYFAAKKSVFSDIKGFDCPFENFLTKGDPYNGYGGSVSEGLFTEPEAQRYGMMTFVANGYYPVPTTQKDSSGKKVTTYSLDDTDNQPFKRESLQKDTQPELDNFADYAYSASGAQKWQVSSSGNEGRLNLLNQAALWDYLDADSVPCSICIPTVERTPMICGVSPQFSSSSPVEVKVKQSPSKKDTASDVKGTTKVTIGSDQWDMYSREITYTLDIGDACKAINTISVLACYPFREFGISGWDNTSYYLDGRFALFFTASGSPITIHPSSFKSYLKKDELDQKMVLDKSVICLPLKKGKKFTPKNDIVSTDDSVIPKPRDVLGVAVENDAPADADLMIAKIKYTWPRDKYVDDGTGTLVPQMVNPDPIVGANTTIEVTQEGLCYLSDKGAATSLKSKLQNKEDITLNLNFATWVRMTDSKDKTVDLVPACSLDDENVAKNTDSKCAEVVSGGDMGYPLLRVAAEGDLSLSINTLLSDSTTLGTITPPSVKWITADPRYNYAAANWVMTKGDSNLQPTDWSNNEEIKKLVSSGDGDAYMSTSDACYMQSIFELAFLPRVSNGFGGGSLRGDMFSGKLSTSQSKFNPSDYPTTFSSAKDADFMWKTYDPFGRWNDSEFSDLTDIIVTGDGMKVNPYTSSRDVLMAAFANTPCDWRCASTNYTSTSKRNGVTTFEGMESEEFNQDYAWNGYNDNSKLCWECLADFADVFSTAMRKGTSVDDWKDIYDDLGWDVASGEDQCRKIIDDMDKLDSDDSNIYSVDRKFFYGFWRECFAARQQLFLVFVRAEPMMMGGGVAGQTPPQLGARAVAVVWRDPTATSGSGTDTSSTATPHRSRILFYHQFD